MPAPAPPVVVTCKDAEHLAAAAAEHIIAAAAAAIRERGRFLLALSGGSTPEKTYTLLARPESSGRLDWARAWLFFGDERLVPHEDPRSNCHMARRSLLDHIPVPPGHVFPIPVDRPSPVESAAAYAQTLATAFGIDPQGPPPRFDLVLLGLGDDGHTASLFPGAAALNEMRAWVTWSPPGVLPPPVDRVTLTYPVLNAAREVLFLVAGAGKSVPLRDVLEGGAPREQRPSAGVQPVEGAVTWLIDEAAAGLLRSGARA
jgi:6-phosphogluconolactonase